MVDRFTPPGMSTNIDADGTVIVANAALHAAVWVWHDHSRRGSGMAAGIGFKYIHNGQEVSSITFVAQVLGKLRGITIKF